MRTLALDIGGANLKAAHSEGSVRSAPFELWRNPNELTPAIADLCRGMPKHDALAVTMTAELCDCYETKSKGVLAVLSAIEKFLGKRKRTAPARVWLTNGKLATLSEARSQPQLAAASNWLALATWAGRLCGTGRAIVMDIGSTTSDIIPLHDGVPVPRGRTDRDRLASGELVYAGVRRTPLAALVHALDVSGQTCRVASEHFATTWDAYLWLGEIAEEPRNRLTADGRPATRAAAAARLARVVCSDRTLMSDDDISQIARQVADAQRSDLLRALRSVEMILGGHAGTVISAGSGEFLTRRIIERLHQPPTLVSLADQLGPDVSAAACAYALATLAAECLAEKSHGR
jgi:probable H4MPT-linked C1 transfer pathway protein